MNSINNIYNRIISSTDYNVINDTYTFKSKPGISSTQFEMQKSEMLYMCKEVQGQVTQVKHYYLPKVKMAEAQYYRKASEHKLNLHNPFQYARFHQIMNQYDNQY